jgi:hypothetical protein
MQRSKLTRVRTPDGDWYVATSSANWAKAIALSNIAAHARQARMEAWEKANHPGGYPDAAYWQAYNAEKYRIPINWPMPEGHVMFKAKSGAKHESFQI